jgi:tetratricopeptide (TPR) repeat protein
VKQTLNRSPQSFDLFIPIPLSLLPHKKLIVMLRKILFIAAATAFLFPAFGQQLRTPAPSPAQTIKQDFGLSSIELSYSRPGVKGRKVYGDLVPFGKVWRTGANNATTLNFEDDVMIGDTKIKAGKYGLLTIPGEKEWTLIISKSTSTTSPADYKQEEDVVRVNVKPMTMKDKMETFTLQFANVKNNSCELHIMWEHTAVALPISTDVDTKVMADIERIMNRDTKPYFSAAMYYLDNGKDLKQALAWFDKAIEINPNAFWVHHQRANCLAKLGMKAEAKAAAEKSMELAVAAKNDDYVTLNQKLLAQLK